VKLKRPLETNYNQEEVFPISIDFSHKQKNKASPFSSASDDFDFMVEKPIDSNLHKKFGWLEINRIYSSNGYGQAYLLKRPFDILLSIIGLVLSFPIWIVVAVAIYVEDGAPVIFAQTRLGKDGRKFKFYKFRSMIKNAEAGTGPVWAYKEDSRITTVGKFLRKTALDELPQLLNILLGQMSFVGPRAERPEFVSEFRKIIPGFNNRLLVRPGLTGVAQVYGHYYTQPRNKLRYDMLYIYNQSFLFDLKLIFASFWYTFRGKWAT